MRKNQRLLIAGILLLATTGVAQGQAVYEAFGNAVMARDGRRRGEGWGHRAVLEKEERTTGESSQ